MLIHDDSLAMQQSTTMPSESCINFFILIFCVCVLRAVPLVLVDGYNISFCCIKVLFVFFNIFRWLLSAFTLRYCSFSGLTNWQIKWLIVSTECAAKQKRIFKWNERKEKLWILKLREAIHDCFWNKCAVFIANHFAQM